MDIGLNASDHTYYMRLSYLIAAIRRTCLKFAFISCFLLVMGSLYSQETFYDRFEQNTYTNNDGSLQFSTGWIETNEATDPDAGRIRIEGNELEIKNMDNVTIQRSLDLASALSATLTFDYDRKNGNETIRVQLWDGTQFNTRATLNGDGLINYTLTAAERNANATLRFTSGSGGWGSTEEYEIDDVLFTVTMPSTISINNVTVDEAAATATFTATHIGQNAAGPFTVNWQTADGTALAGTEYVAASNVMSFTGTIGDTETIVVNLTAEDNIYEFIETFFIQMTVTSDPTVDISREGAGNITDNEVIQGNTPLTLFQELGGYMDYTSTGGTLRTQPNTVDHCAITTSSSNTITTNIPATGTITNALLYWTNSNPTMDPQITFEGQTIEASLVYQSVFSGRNFFNHSADVTALVQGIPNINTNVFDFSGLTITNTGSHCTSGTVLGGWALFIFYSDPGLPASTINLYQGFDADQNTTTSFGLSGFYAIGSIGSKTTILSWEGDQTLANNESLAFITPTTGSNILSGDGDNTTGTNPFNSTHYDNVDVPVTNNSNSYGVDLDTYDVSAFIVAGESTATTQVNVGQDLVLMNLVILKVPSNIIIGNVFEDINYGGGAGRDRTAAGVAGIPNVTVELYDSTNTLFKTTVTDAAGDYGFTGMANDTYTVRVVTGTIDSTRPNGTGCGNCYPVQTYKTDFASSTLTPNPSLVGGNDPTAASDTGTGVLTGAQSTATVAIFNEGAVGVDFGFNYNTIVNTNNSGQGSLEQFIINSNDLGEGAMDVVANGIFDPPAGQDISIFMIPPSGDPLGRPADVNFLAGGYFDLDVTGNQLSEIKTDNTAIDGRTQTAYGDTNTGGAGSGGTPVGVSATNLPVYEQPEIQIRGNNQDVIRLDGDNLVVRGLAIYATDNSGILARNGSATIEENFIGINAEGTDVGTQDYGVHLKDGDLNLASNYISGSEKAGFYLENKGSPVIEYNHFYRNGSGDTCMDNIYIRDGTDIVIQYNLIAEAAGTGIEADQYEGTLNILENTITNNGISPVDCGGGVFEDAGIRLLEQNASITQNIIHSNQGEGLVIAKDNVINVLISENSFYNNGQRANSLGIDLDDSQNNGDGITLNDPGDSDNGANGLLNFPIIESAYIQSGNVVIKGWARPGSIMEFFLTDISEGTATLGDNQLGFSQDYGEGELYLGTVIEGSAGDSDSSSSSYTDADGNTDNTSRFQISVPIQPGVTVGDYVTATATISNTTSEFSPQRIITLRTVITNRRITYRVNPN